jgi:hypothetical protein
MAHFINQTIPTALVWKFKVRVEVREGINHFGGKDPSTPGKAEQVLSRTWSLLKQNSISFLVLWGLEQLQELATVTKIDVPRTHFLPAQTGLADTKDFLLGFEIVKVWAGLLGRTLPMLKGGENRKRCTVGVRFGFGRTLWSDGPA